MIRIDFLFLCKPMVTGTQVFVSNIPEWVFLYSSGGESPFHHDICAQVGQDCTVGMCKPSSYVFVFQSGNRRQGLDEEE
jgi:hypothetical protein